MDDVWWVSCIQKRINVLGGKSGLANANDMRWSQMHYFWETDNARPQLTLSGSPACHYLCWVCARGEKTNRVSMVSGRQREYLVPLPRSAIVGVTFLQASPLPTCRDGDGCQVFHDRTGGSSVDNNSDPLHYTLGGCSCSKGALHTFPDAVEEQWTLASTDSLSVFLDVTRMI